MDTCLEMYCSVFYIHITLSHDFFCNCSSLYTYLWEKLLAIKQTNNAATDSGAAQIENSPLRNALLPWLWEKILFLAFFRWDFRPEVTQEERNWRHHRCYSAGCYYWGLYLTRVTGHYNLGSTNPGLSSQHSLLHCPINILKKMKCTLLIFGHY